MRLGTMARPQEKGHDRTHPLAKGDDADSRADIGARHVFVCLCMDVSVGVWVLYVVGWRCHVTVIMGSTSRCSQGSGDRQPWGETATVPCHCSRNDDPDWRGSEGCWRFQG